jgi:hypothetical protein
MPKLYQMWMRTADAIHWKACAASLVFLLLTGVPATSGEHEHATGAAFCAEREVLLQTLVEAQGPPPNAASAMLAEASLAISQARADCGHGRAEGALAIYDGLIAKLTRASSDRETASATGRER